MSIPPVATVPPAMDTPEASGRAAAPVVATRRHDEMAPAEGALEEAVARLNDALRAWSTQLRFRIDGDTGRVVITVVDSISGETVRQIPAEEVMNMSRELGKLRDLAFRASA